MISENSTSIAESSRTDMVVAHFKNPDYQRGNKDLASRTAFDYMFSPIDEVRRYLERRVKKGDIRTDKPVLIAGCGDFRSGALLSSMGLETYGVDYNDEVCLLGADNILELERRNAIQENLARILIGDFTKSETYQRMGMKFSDFGTIFNYHVAGRHEGLSKKVSEESPAETILILLSNVIEEDPRIPRMKLARKSMIRKNYPIYARMYRKTDD